MQEIEPEHVESALRMARAYCRGRYCDADAIEGAALEGLARAARDFDPGKGVEFGAYAYRRVRWAILDETRRVDGYVRQGRDGQWVLHAALPLEEGLVAREGPGADVLLDLADGIRRLPPRERFVVLAVAAGYSQVELARVLGVDDSRVSHLKGQARRRLAA